MTDIAGTDCGPPCNVCLGTIWAYHWDAEYDSVVPICCGCHRADVGRFEPMDWPQRNGSHGWTTTSTAAELRAEHIAVGRRWATTRAMRLREHETEYVAVFTMLTAALEGRGVVARPDGNDDDALLVRRGIKAAISGWSLIERQPRCAPDFYTERYALTAFGWHVARAIADGRIVP